MIKYWRLKEENLKIIFSEVLEKVRPMVGGAEHGNLFRIGDVEHYS